MLLLILGANCLLSILGFLITVRVIPRFKEMFLKAGLGGMDMCKQEQRRIPEAGGVISGTVFLIVMFLFIPVPFFQYWTTNTSSPFPHHEFVKLVAALLSICCMLFLGFADDVLDLKWRHKLLLPTLASLPLLMVYYVTYNGTNIMIPKPLHWLFGPDLSLGPLYYVYMGMLAVFCTNAINIIAGINGIEVGQSVVICGSIIIFNIVELSGDCWKAHLFSLYFMPPFFATALGLMYYNWYPSQVFVGDTLCYFSGMTFAVVGILGHFGKTMLLFFIPQVFNFLLSVPQLFHFVPCPRHRLPRYIKEVDKLDTSVCEFKPQSLSIIGKLFVKLYSGLGFIRLRPVKEDLFECSNFTIINMVLKLCGPMHEKSLVTVLLVVQVLCSCLAFFIRYGLVTLFY